MLWGVRELMKPALSVIDMIPNVHRTATLTVFRRAVLEGRPMVLRLSGEEKELAFHDAAVQLTSPVGARVLLALYRGGHVKLKKPPQKSLPALEAYIATEASFRAEVERVLAAEESRRDRLAAIIADPAAATEAELSPYLIDKVMSAKLGHAAVGEILIAGVTCHRALIRPAEGEERLRSEGRMICWWHDAAGRRHGDAE